MPATEDLTIEDANENVIASIREVYDPEIPVNVYDLGLIYEIEIDPETRKADVLMTLTAPNCPAAGVLPGQVEDAAANAEGVSEAEVELTFEPPFSPEMMSEEAKLELGLA
ncbi:MAG: FeS assembly SUF system protein [Bacteroidetes bacterium QS_7_67_15]|jgi:FeS assembly SUF system protein|nr:MAG: FeS assembly SUF system protein [Bacteroidetes bacterium QH_8_67_23]PSQ83509.1 MAG: FeS assembly SUF system protein [Bacteroidetes bacterium QS_7_67_15]PSQ93721.1 MAG: FeS assembly SUF system protein [Bacteroidetes bacterium SW_4_67_19]